MFHKQLSIERDEGLIFDWIPWTTNTTPGGFDEQRFQKGGLKGFLVVVDEVASQRLEIGN